MMICIKCPVMLDIESFEICEEVPYNWEHTISVVLNTLENL